MLGLNTGPTNAVLRTARRQDKGAKACKQPLLTNCLHFLNNFYFFEHGGLEENVAFSWASWLLATLLTQGLDDHWSGAFD